MDVHREQHASAMYFGGIIFARAGRRGRGRLRANGVSMSPEK